MSGKLALNQLEQYLSKAAWILKGPVDAADFKAYIFPLLFFKRISDVYDDEYQDALKESGGDVEYANLPEFHRFTIPEKCHWNDIRETTQNIGQKLQYAFREIEKVNQKHLYGIFGDTQWSNKEKLSDELLVNLVEHFSQYNLSNKQVEPDILGQAYEYLIKHFADITNKKAGEFYTPRPVVQLMMKILDPRPGDRIYDPACGTGGMLLEAVHLVKQRKQDPRTLKLYGQEKNLTTSTISRMNMFLHNIEDFSIIRGDTLREPAFFDGDELATFNCVVANPPFSLKSWGRKYWEQDPYRRNKYGLPNDSNGDFAWVQHMIASMDSITGRMAVVLPHGVLFRKGTEGKIREGILKDDLIEAVIGLGPNIFYGTQLAASILVLRMQKPKEKREKVLFIDASKQYRAGRAQNYLEQEHIDKIFEWYSDYKSVENTVNVSTIQNIKENEWSLNIPLYIEQKDENNLPSVKEAKAEVKKAAEKVWQAEKDFKKQLQKFGLLS
jgi:type I restriction enzyme M protein